MSSFGPLISAWKEVKHFSTISIFNNVRHFISIKNAYYHFQISCVVKYVNAKYTTDQQIINQHICLFLKNSTFIVFGKVTFTKQCLLHLSREVTCIFISVTFRSYIYTCTSSEVGAKISDTANCTCNSHDH